MGESYASASASTWGSSSFFIASPCSSVGKEPACNAGDPSSIPGSGKSPGEGRGYSLQDSCTSLVAQLVKNPPAMQETWVRSLSWKESLEKGKATHPSILAWTIPCGRKSRTWLNDFHFHLTSLLRLELICIAIGHSKRPFSWPRWLIQGGCIIQPESINNRWNFCRYPRNRLSPIPTGHKQIYVAKKFAGTILEPEGRD